MRVENRDIWEYAGPGFILRRVLTSFRYQNSYCGYRGSQKYHYGRYAVLKLIFIAPKFSLRRVKKKGKKG